jgi:hypothetical protein
LSSKRAPKSYQLIKYNTNTIFMKMNMLKCAVILLITVAGFSSCTKVVGDGPILTESRTATNFSEIEMNIPGDVVVRQANDYKLEIEAQENILDIIQTPVNGNELVIKFKNDVIVRRHDRIRVTITSPGIRAFRLNGSGNLRTEGNIQSDHFKLRVSGSGNINMSNLNGTTLEADISGSGDIMIAGGVVNSEDLRISGSGSIDLLHLAARSASTNTTGSGEMKLNVSETLNARITGSGSVYYKGNPLVSSHISGSGKVRPM